jgi:preprotein translocase subunit SecG
MVILLTIVHIIVCLFLVVVVLLQSGKAADLAGAFGGMGSQTVFGPRGSATLLSKATTIAAAVFMVTSLSLSIMATRAGRGSPALLNKVSKPAPAQAQPVAPAQTAPGGTIPITVTPSVDGKSGPAQTIPAPVIPNPNQQQQKK